MHDQSDRATRSLQVNATHTSLAAYAENWDDMSGISEGSVISVIVSTPR